MKPIDLKLIRERASHLYHTTRYSTSRICTMLAMEFPLSDKTIKDIITYTGAYYTKDNTKALPLRYVPPSQQGRPRADKVVPTERLVKLYKYYRTLHPDEAETRILNRVGLKVNLHRSTVKKRLVSN